MSVVADQTLADRPLATIAAVSDEQPAPRFTRAAKKRRAASPLSPIGQLDGGHDLLTEGDNDPERDGDEGGGDEDDPATAAAAPASTEAEAEAATATASVAKMLQQIKLVQCNICRVNDHFAYKNLCNECCVKKEVRSLVLCISCKTNYHMAYRGLCDECRIG